MVDTFFTALATLLTLHHVVALSAGVALGLVVGVLPGLGPLGLGQQNLQHAVVERRRDAFVVDLVAQDEQQEILRRENDIRLLTNQLPAVLWTTDCDLVILDNALAETADFHW